MSSCEFVCRQIKLQCVWVQRERQQLRPTWPPLWFWNPALSAPTAECAASLQEAAEGSHRDPIRDTSSALHCRPEPQTLMNIFQVYAYFSTGKALLWNVSYPSSRPKVLRSIIHRSPLIQPLYIFLLEFAALDQLLIDSPSIISRRWLLTPFWRTVWALLQTKSINNPDDSHQRNPCSWNTHRHAAWLLACNDLIACEIHSRRELKQQQGLNGVLRMEYVYCSKYVKLYFLSLYAERLNKTAV